MTWIHILAGFLALISGATALYARKGARMHRRSGMVFVYTMLVMAGTGAVIAQFLDERPSVMSGMLTLYLVVTALFTVKPPALSARAVYSTSLIIALGISFYGLRIALIGRASPDGLIDGLPPEPMFFTAFIALIAATGDLRMLLMPVAGTAYRIARHLWRMCFALFSAAAAFFLGQMSLFPEPLQNISLLSVPVILVLLSMFYWLVRVLSGHYRMRTTELVNT